MSVTLENNKRIVKNTLFLYIRMLLGLIVSLYTSRIVLQVLGVEDFGIYNIVGGVVSILSFFISSLSNGSQRYMSIGLGKQNLLETEYAFRQSLTLMFLLSILLLLFCETLGLWFVYNKLIIPHERLHVAIWVYQFSIISVLSTINQIPLVGAIIAHEQMNVYAYLGLFEIISRLLIVYLLKLENGIDSLFLYGLLSALVSIIMWLFYAYYSIKKNEECKFRFYWNFSLVKDMSQFVGQNLFGCFAWAIGSHGTNILLNLYFGPTVNAARAIALQVNNAIIRLIENMTTAIKPQIVKSYVLGDEKYILFLVEKASKYSFFAFILLSVPIMIDLKFILCFWLGSIPEYVVSFTRLILCESLFVVLSSPLMVVANATGYIKRTQVYGRSLILLSLPLNYLLLSNGMNSETPFIISVFINFLYWLYCLYDIHKQMKLDIIRYIKLIIKPAFILLLFLYAIGELIIHIFPQDSFLRFLFMFFCLVSMGCGVIFYLLDINERIAVHNMVKKIFKSCFSKFQKF